MVTLGSLQTPQYWSSRRLGEPSPDDSTGRPSQQFAFTWWVSQWPTTGASPGDYCALTAHVVSLWHHSERIRWTHSFELSMNSVWVHPMAYMRSLWVNCNATAWAVSSQRSPVMLPFFFFWYPLYWTIGSLGWNLRGWAQIVDWEQSADQMYALKGWWSPGKVESPDIYCQYQFFTDIANAKEEDMCFNLCPLIPIEWKWPCEFWLLWIKTALKI